MPTITMDLPFEPMPKLRPRFSIHHGRVLTHTPPKTKEFETMVAEYYRLAHSYTFEQHKPITVSIDFCLSVPASTSKKRKADMISGVIKHTVKPDIDNLTKAMLDALNGIAWYDDAQITMLHVSKSYAETPHIMIAIHD